VDRSIPGLTHIIGGTPLNVVTLLGSQGVRGGKVQVFVTDQVHSRLRALGSAARRQGRGGRGGLQLRSFACKGQATPTRPPDGGSPAILMPPRARPQVLLPASVITANPGLAATLQPVLG
jgi:hypothetical protein